MDDSDSDDDLLLSQPTFAKKKSRQEDAKKRKQQALLDDALAESDRQMESFVRMTKIKRENQDIEKLDDAVLREQAEILTQSTRKVSTLTRRQEAEDTFEGVLSPSRDDGALSRKEGVELQSAFDTQLNACLGARDIITFNEKSAKNVCGFFSNLDDAKKSLTVILNKISKEKKSEVSSKQQKLLSDIKEAMDCDILEEFFLSGKIVELSSEDEFGPLHVDLVRWFQIASYSPLGYNEFNLQAIARNCLKSLYNSGTEMKDSDNFSLESLLTILNLWIRDNCKEGDDSKKERTSDAINNPGGLNSVLSVWEYKIPHCDPVANDSERTIRCVSMISLILLDASILSNTSYDEIRRAACRVITALIDLLEQQSKEESIFLENLKAIPKSIFEGLNMLGPGRKGSENEKDTDAWLCHSAIVRAIPHRAKTGEALHPSLCQLKSQMALQSIRTCLEIEDIEDKTRKCLQETGHKNLAELCSSDCWLAMGAFFMALVEVDARREFFSQEAIHFLAIVDSACLAYIAGLNLLRSQSSGMAGVALEYGSMEQAKNLLYIHDMLDEQITQVARFCSSLLTNPYFRHADFLLKSAHQVIANQRPRLSRLSGMQDSPAAGVQSTLHSFFRPSKKVSPIHG